MTSDMKIPKHIENYISRYGEINRRFVMSGLRTQINQIVIIPALAEMNSMFAHGQPFPKSARRHEQNPDRLCDQ